MLASVVGGLLVGMSSTWWTKKHTRHHAAPNQIDKDPDIAPTVVRFYPPDSRQRSRLLAFITAHQGWWFFPVLIFEGINLHQQSVRTLFARGHVKRRWLELSLLSVRIFGYLAVLFLFLPIGLAFAFLAVQLSVFGVYLGCSFAPNHKGMPLVPKDMSIDFFRRQVLMSRNVGEGRTVTFLLGGLNFQIEHHLFPSMPRPTLRRAQPIVREFCRSSVGDLHRRRAVHLLRHRRPLPEPGRAASQGSVPMPAGRGVPPSRMSGIRSTYLRCTLWSHA